MTIFQPVPALQPTLAERSAKAAVLGKIMARLANLWSAWRNRNAVRTLLEIDEHMLRDMGLTRSDVTSALALPAREDPSIRLAAVSIERRDAVRATARERIGLASARSRTPGPRRP